MEGRKFFIKDKIPHGVGTIYSQSSIFYGAFNEGVPFGKGLLIM